MKERGTQIIATWDDHDFGINDGGAEFVNKKPIRKLFLDAMDEPLNSPRRLDDDSPIH